MSDKIREAFNRIHAKIIDGNIASAFSIFKEGYEAGAALAGQPAAAVPDGWKLVPLRATREQVNAVCMHPDLARTLYRNMVEAAPAAPESTQEPVAFAVMTGDKVRELSVYRGKAETYSEAWNAGGMDEEAEVVPLGRITALPAAEQPDTVKVPRETAEAICRLVKGIGPVEDLRALLGKEGA